MKVTISIPDDVLAAIDSQSERLRISRSAYMTKIARLHLRGLSDAERTAQINTFLEETGMPLEPAVREATQQTMKNSEW
jgi:metal-responsive CopG/Arc/MetJ family transcriptional regulator